jgi:adenylate kinase family enzyme
MTTWTSRDELEAAVVDYQRNWWRTDDDALAVINDRVAHPGLRSQVLTISSMGQMVTTSDVYRPDLSGTHGARGYLLVRTPVHELIVADCVPRDAIPPDTSTEQPTAYFTIGCPGAGKTTVLRRIVNEHRSRLASGTEPTRCSIIDADRVRQLLPEYRDGLGAFVVEEECYALTYGEVFDRAVARGGDIVYDTIGRLPSMKENLELLAAAGYDIHVLHATSDLDLCAERTEQRALQVDGRLVNPAMLERAASDAAETIGALLTEGFALAGWAQIATDDMAVPTLIEGTPPWTEML